MDEQELQDLIRTFSNPEKRLLRTLADIERAPPDQLRKSGGFKSLTEVMSAGSWLRMKGLVQIDEEPVVYVSLKKKQLASKELPERRALKLLKKARGQMSMGEMRDSGKLSGQEVSIAFGWLKRKGWADIRKEGGTTLLTMTDKGKEAISRPGADEAFIARLGKEDEVLASEVEPKVIKDLKSRKEIIKEREMTLREFSLTPAGLEVSKSKLPIKEEVASLTPQMLHSGKWEKAEFRRYDVQTFAPTVHPGKLHPLGRLIQSIREIFFSLGFSEIEGDYIQSSFWNMDALFIPQDHPAREIQDTFYMSEPSMIDLPDDKVDLIKGVHENGGGTGSIGWGYQWKRDVAEKAMLRTHTTVNTIRYLAENPESPLKVFGVGRVFRHEAIDSTHLPEFHQIEGIAMEEGASLQMLIGLLKEFYKLMGFPNIRIRPSYFPYTEPSLEVDAEFRGKWLELGGAGIFRPEVTEPLGVKHPVMAWGLGLERLAMVTMGIKDIRSLYLSDVDWLKKTPL